MIPGPIIVLKKGVDPGGGLDWEVDSQVQNNGGPANGTLRQDFIGLSIKQFEYRKAGGQWQTARHIIVTGTNGAELEIKRSSLDTLNWIYTDSNQRSCMLIATDRYEGGSVPSECFELPGPLTEAGEGEVEQIRFCVWMP